MADFDKLSLCTGGKLSASLHSLDTQKAPVESLKKTLDVVRYAYQYSINNISPRFIIPLGSNPAI